VESLYDDQSTAVSGTVEPQRPVERLDIAVWAEDALGPRQLDTIEHAIVDDRVADDQVFRAEKATDHRHVGGVAADERQRRLGAVQARQGELEVAMDLTLAGGKPARRHRCAKPVDGV